MSRSRRKLPVTIETKEGGYVLETPGDVHGVAKRVTSLSAGFIRQSSVEELVGHISRAVDATHVYYDGEAER